MIESTPAANGKAEAAEAEESPALGPKDSLARRICHVMAQVSKIEKTGTNEHHRYKFIEAAEVVAAVRPHLARAGVMILPQVLGVDLAGKNVQVRMRFTLINADDRDDRLDMDWIAEAQDTQDKAINKATTAAMKYMLLRLFLLSDREDPDSEGPDPRAGEGRSAAQPARVPQKAQEQPPAREEPSFTVRAGAALRAPAALTEANNNGTAPAPDEGALAALRAEVVRLLADDGAALELLRAKGTLPPEMNGEQLAKAKRWLLTRAQRNVAPSTVLGRQIERASSELEIKEAVQAAQKAKDQRQITVAEFQSLLREAETRRTALAGPLTSGVAS